MRGETRLGPPPQSAFTREEWAIVRHHKTPRAVQQWLHRLPYNHEKDGGTLRCFRGVVAHGVAHCLEAALSAATILEQHGYPPRLLSFESVDKLDHVIYPFVRDGRWGAVARSRDPGLHGRRPAYLTPLSLAASYMETYVDLTGRVTGYAVADLADVGGYDWRFSTRNVWKIENWLIEYPHHRLGMSDQRYERLLAKYRAFKERWPDRKPVYYSNRRLWM